MKACALLRNLLNMALLMAIWKITLEKLQSVIVSNLK